MRYFTYFFIALIILLPVSTSAQSELKSNNFTLDGINFGSSFVLTGEFEGIPPIIVDGPTISEIEANKAVVQWKSDRKTSSTVKYGTTTSYGQESGNVDLVIEHKITIFGLLPETLYHFKVVTTDESRQKTESVDKTFTTLAQAGITGIKISDITYDKALVTWKTGSFAKSKLEYGTTTSYGSTKETSSSLGFTTDHTQQLTDLKPGTEYHLRVVAEDNKGEVSRSSDLTFNTIPQPSFLSLSAESKTPNSATVTWETNTLTSGTVVYQKDGDSETKTVGTIGRAKKQTVVIAPLIGDATYKYAVNAIDEQGKQVSSEQKTFKTAPDFAPPKIENLKVKITRSENDLVLTAIWVTDEPSSSEAILKAKSGNGATVEIPEQGQLTTNHVVVKTGIDPAVAYSLTAVSKDPSGNTGQSAINFSSPAVRKSIITLIIESALRSFGWVNRVFK